jgi:hypothetical protein
VNILFLLNLIVYGGLLALAFLAVARFVGASRVATVSLRRSYSMAAMSDGTLSIS